MKNRNELPELFNTMGLLGCGAEIGVDIGNYAWELLFRWRGKKLYLVDDWRWDMNGLTGNARLGHAVKLLMPFEGRTKFVVHSSPGCATQFEDESLDWIYIDANHAYKAVMADFKAWYPKLKRGGVFAGHDYMQSEDPNRLMCENFVDEPPVELKEEQFEDWGVKAAVTTFRWQLNLKDEPEVTQEENEPKSFYWIKT